jgi:hypothetical protein
LEERKSRLSLLTESGDFVPHSWGNGYQDQQFRWGRRLICSSESAGVDFLSRLVFRYPGPYHVTYVLEDNDGAPEFRRGRYISPNALTEAQLRIFLDEFRQFLEEDGRHNLMIRCAKTDGTVVYDQHDYFFVYGGIGDLLRELVDEGYQPRTYGLGRHGHQIGHDIEPLQRLMAFRRWQGGPLEATDTPRHRAGLFDYVMMKLRAIWNDWTNRAPD